MLFLRNPEVKKMFAALAVTTVLAAAGAAVFGIAAAVYVSVVCVILILMFSLFTAKRYKNISQLSYQVDLILHGIEIENFVPDREGELAVLSSEIYKMTLRLQEQADLLQKEKEHLSNSIADISHQVRTPLTSIRMIVPRLGRENISAEQSGEYIREVSRLLSRVEWLITALLKIARLESGTVVFEHSPVEVKEVIRKALKPLEIPAEIKDIALDIDVPLGLYFDGDLAWSVEAVGNILKNCIEHMPEKGKLKIKASGNPIYTEILISDTGAGIAPEDLPHLFERFYKGKDSGRENIGIGLALSRMIIKSQNGIIKAGNAIPQGAQFTIRFYKGSV